MQKAANKFLKGFILLNTLKVGKGKEMEMMGQNVFNRVMET